MTARFQRVRDGVRRARAGSSRLLVERVVLDARRRANRARSAAPATRGDEEAGSTEYCARIRMRHVPAALASCGLEVPNAGERDLLLQGVGRIFGQDVSLPHPDGPSERSRGPGIDGTEQRARMELARLGHLLPALGGQAPNESSTIADELARLAPLPPGHADLGGPLDAAFRIVHCVQLLVGESVPGDERAALGREVDRSARWLWLHREVGPIRSNHYLGSLMGLAAAASVVERSTARTYRRYVERRLPGELDHQLLPDGVFHEGSTFYSKLCLEMLVAIVLVADESWDRALVARCQDAIRHAWQAIVAISWADGTVPNVGDCDSAQVFRYAGSAPSDLAELAVVVAVALDDTPPAPMSRPARAWLSSSGIVSISDGDLEVRADLGPLGLRGFGGHGHADFGSVVVRNRGTDVVVDPGSSVYASDLAVRLFERSSHAHNMVTPADRELYDLEETAPFRIGASSLSFERWVDVEGPQPQWRARVTDHRAAVALERTVELDLGPDEPALVITDRAAGLRHGDSIESNFLVPGLTDPGPGPHVIEGPSGPVAAFEVADGSIEIRPGSWSQRFGERRPGSTLSAVGSADGTGRASTRSEIRFF